jgi:hypothetical protein
MMGMEASIGHIWMEISIVQTPRVSRGHLTSSGNQWYTNAAMAAQAKNLIDFFVTVGLRCMALKSVTLGSTPG